MGLFARGIDHVYAHRHRSAATITSALMNEPFRTSLDRSLRVLLPLVIINASLALEKRIRKELFVTFLLPVTWKDDDDVAIFPP